MQIFPKRSKEEKREAVYGWVWTGGFFLALAVVGLGAFFIGDMPGDGTMWDAVRWIGLVVGAVAAYLFLQAVFHTLIEATIGPERFIAAIIALMAVGGAMTLLGIE